MKTLATRKGLLLLGASAAIVIPTHLVPTSAFTPPAPRLHLHPTALLRADTQGATAASKRRCTTHRTPATSMSSGRKHPADDAPIRSTLQLLRNSRRTAAGGKKRTTSSWGLAGEEQGPIGVPPTATAATGVGGGVPEEGMRVEVDSVSEAAEPAAEAGPTSFLSVKGMLRQLDRVQKQVRDVPEDAADEGRFLMMAALVGILTGSAVTVFKTMIGAAKKLSYGDLIDRFPAGTAVYAVALIPVLGAFGVVGIMRALEMTSYGPGLGGLTEEVDKQVPWDAKRTFGKTLAAVATLGTGNSLGPEGPAVELGVASSRYVSSMSNLSVERQRMLLGAGAAAGVAAGFNAPIAGIFFALEIVKDTFNTNYNSKSFIAATLLCAVVSALMAKIGLHDELSLRPAAYNLESPLIELPLYLGLGIVAGLVAVMFKYFSRKSADVFDGNFPGFRWMKKVPQWSKPIMMASVTGLVGLFYPQVLFFGYDTLDKLLANTGSYSLPLLCFLCVGKALLTAGALGSGLVGGTFAPALFLGATAGAAYQRILQGSLTAFRSTAGSWLAVVSTFLLPITAPFGLGGPTGDLSSLLTIAGSPAYAMVGAAAVLSALYRAPLTGSLLLFELTKDYDIVLPLMAAAGVSSLVVELFSRADTKASALAAMPRDMSLEIGLKISGKVDELMGKVQNLDTRRHRFPYSLAVAGGTMYGMTTTPTRMSFSPRYPPATPHVTEEQVADALVPRVLTLSSDMLLSDAMRAFRLTRNEFAIVVGPSVFDTAREGSDAREVEGSSETPADGEDVTAGGTSWKAQTLLAEDMWERRDLQLIGVLALREIILALERERSSFGRDDREQELTAGSVCRRNCFTVKASTDIAAARAIMESKGVRFLPVVVDLPPAASLFGSDAPFARTWPGQRREELGEEQQASNHTTLPFEQLPRVVVGVLSRDSVRIAGRLTETERAIRDRPYSPLPRPDSTERGQE